MAEATKRQGAREIMVISPVIPVVTVEDPKTAAPMAQALVEGGISIIEVTLRTPSALEALRRIVEEVPQMTAGAGTILDPRQADQAMDAGAEFLVSPGLSASLSRWIADAEVPFLGGVSDLGQVLDARDQGLTELKFFPAEPAGGTAYLKAIAAPVPDVVFCPTGGISAANAPDYLGLSNVACVGGSWLTPMDAVAAGGCGEITRRAREAAALA